MWLWIISGSDALRKPTYGFAKEGQKPNVYQKPFPATWRCQCPRATPDLSSWVRAAEFLLLLAGCHKSSKHSAACRDRKCPDTAEVFPGCAAVLDGEWQLVFHQSWSDRALLPSPGVRQSSWAAPAGAAGWEDRAHTAVLTCLLSGSVPCWPCRQAISLFWARWHTDLTLSRRLSIWSARGEKGGRENNTKTRSYFSGLSRKPSPCTTLCSGLQISQILQLTRSAAA